MHRICILPHKPPHKQCRINMFMRGHMRKTAYTQFMRLLPKGTFMRFFVVTQICPLPNTHPAFNDTRPSLWVMGIHIE